MTEFPSPHTAARIAAFLDEHLSWSAWWDKHAGLWCMAGTPEAVLKCK